MQCQHTPVGPKDTLSISAHLGQQIHCQHQPVHWSDPLPTPAY